MRGAGDKCDKFPYLETPIDYLVNQSTDGPILNYRYASTARSYNHMCGQKGRYHKEIEPETSN